MSSNSLSLTNTKDATFNKLSLVTSTDVKNVYDIFALKTEIDNKADKNNTKLTGNVGINTTTPDSALHIVGAKVDNPSTVGIRMGKSSNFNTGATQSYGIEITSDTDSTGGSYIDFTYPYSSNLNYYAGRMFFENNNEFFCME